ncbi:ATP-binding protein [Glaciimonas soli]|uniref:histidine kinase n=1 Tax=Glaciimonas soli TaxID=2590999 RepID=A0A843Z1A4_9BURK|nr:ATP-binding protein [Glaciimonas soli]MQR02636.1 GHKL domain-containing protein [Glaciimonas soli]
MDDLKTKLNSLQFRLALALAVTMIVAAIAIGAIGFYSTLHDAHELQDDHLRDIAAMVNANLITVNQPDTNNPGDLEDPDAHVIVQLVDIGPVSHDSVANNQMRFPDGLHDGLQTIRVQQTEWRVFVQTLQTGGKLVVGQKTEAKNEIARHAGRKTLKRILVVIPFLILLLSLTLRRMLAPLSRLAAELNARHAEDIRAISDRGLPAELRPFISAINTVLKRIAITLDQQRRFVADAAHELRSPLTALTLQTKNLARQDMSDEAHHKLNEFERGLKRANDLIDQLLNMARAQLAEPEKMHAVSLQQVVRSVFEEMMPYADAKKIELEFRQNTDVPPITIPATEMDVVTLLRNLVDNAIRYTGPEGKVEVAIQADACWVVLTVQDNGPGIPVAERSRVFDSFYRVLGTGQTGSGLGLSIVKSIVNKLHGEITIDFSDQSLQSGTVVLVKIPQSVR